MRAKQFKTLSGIFKSFDINTYFSLSDFLNGYLYDNKRNKHYKIEFADSLKEQICNLFATAFCSTKNAQKKYAKLLQRYNGKNAGIFERVYISKRNNNIFVGGYCAGQDWRSETRLIQKLIRDNY